MRTFGARLTAVAGAVLLAATMAGCAPEPGSAPEPTGTASTTPDPTPTPTPTVADDPADASPAAMACDDSDRSLVSIMAHSDDDLLFANPEILQALRAGDCVHTVYVTAGDAGNGLDYARARELGILQAYNTLRGQEGYWTDETATLLSGAQVTTFTPDSDPDRVSVTFMRFPDGGLHNEGFEATGFQSLPALDAGIIPTISPIDGGPDVNRDEMVASLEELIAGFHTTSLITLVPADSSWSQEDHPDHSTVGTMVREAADDIDYDGELRFAIGYHSGAMPSNLDESPDLDTKVDAFIRYTNNDWAAACNTRKECLGLQPYGGSLIRQYLLTEDEINERPDAG